MPLACAACMTLDCCKVTPLAFAACITPLKISPIALSITFLLLNSGALQEMYEDIFQLSESISVLFKEEGIMHELYFKGYRRSEAMTLWLKLLHDNMKRCICLF